MAIETSDLHQRAVLWRFDSHDDHGQLRVFSPEEIGVRWVENNREVVSKDGTVVVSTVQAVVEEDIPIDSILWLGELLDLPISPTDLMQVVSKSTVPDLKNRETFRELNLLRYQDTLPTIV